MAKKQVFTTFEAGRYCKVNPYTIRHWVESGKLGAYATPGGHRRIRREELDAFLVAHGMPLPQDFVEGKKRVLFLDDDRGLLEEIERYVGGLSSNLDVRVASGGFAAGMELFTFDPHVIFVDMTMPGQDGPDVLRSIRDCPETSHIRLVALLEDPSVESLEAATAAGAAECLAKPLDFPGLRRLLKALFPYTDFFPA